MPAPHLSGCSQVAWVADEPVLVRNYDYAPELWEETLWRTAWHGRRVVAMGSSPPSSPPPPLTLLLDPDGLDVEEFHHPLTRQLTAEAALFGAAKRQPWIALDEAVDKDRTGVDFGNQPLDAGTVLGP